MDQIACGFITVFSAILVQKYNFNVYNVFFFLAMYLQKQLVRMLTVGYWELHVRICAHS